MTPRDPLSSLSLTSPRLHRRVNHRYFRLCMLVSCAASSLESHTPVVSLQPGSVEASIFLPGTTSFPQGCVATTENNPPQTRIVLAVEMRQFLSTLYSHAVLSGPDCIRSRGKDLHANAILYIAEIGTG